MKKNIIDLTNVEMDFFTAKALGYIPMYRTSQSRPELHVWCKHMGIFKPSQEPKDLFTIIEKGGINITAPHAEDAYWTANIKYKAKFRSLNLSDAVLKCFLTKEYGNIIDTDAIDNDSQIQPEVKEQAIPVPQIAKSLNVKDIFNRRQTDRMEKQEKDQADQPVIKRAYVRKTAEQKAALASKPKRKYIRKNAIQQNDKVIPTTKSNKKENKSINKNHH